MSNIERERERERNMLELMGSLLALLVKCWPRSLFKLGGFVFQHVGWWHGTLCALYEVVIPFSRPFKTKSFGCLVGVLHLFLSFEWVHSCQPRLLFHIPVAPRTFWMIFSSLTKMKKGGGLKEIIQKTSQAHTTSPLVYCLLHIWPHSNCFPFCHIGHAFSVWLSENPLSLSSSI
jgi:hypothetical protein